MLTSTDPPAGRVYLFALTESQADALNTLGQGAPRRVIYEAFGRAGSLDEDGRLSKPCEEAAFMTLTSLSEAEPVQWVGGPPRFDDAALRTDSVRAFVTAVAEAGLFDPSAVGAVTAEMLVDGLGADLSGLLYAAPDGTANWFDWEATTVPPDYVGETRRWSALTGGAWAPEDVALEPLGPDAVRFSFRVGGRDYSADLDVDGDWFRSEFLALLLRSVEDLDPAGRFYWLDGSEAVAFLTPDQAEALRAVPAFARLTRVD